MLLRHDIMWSLGDSKEPYFIEPHKGPTKKYLKQHSFLKKAKAMVPLVSKSLIIQQDWLNKLMTDIVWQNVVMMESSDNHGWMGSKFAGKLNDVTLF